ncbi:hypothetical protein JRQ81_012346 [Phrynocephalus forsythii]|uniref:Serpin domain-containing protein n=1 Tax=Phrynocephalus forsythii TaxID=171643 RepID=A0A9Q1B4W7_9SAUR|nr:hypothetical protein JRQ81_012346 [Phrynocephalus forsythii]
MTTMSEANAKFAIDLFGRLKEEHPCDNILFSPVNATSALGVLALASGCEQAAEIEKILHWDELQVCARPRSAKYLRTVRRFGKTSNRLKVCICKKTGSKHWSISSFCTSLKFIYCALRLYRTEVAGIELQNAPEEARRNINLWVEIRTHGKIMDLLPKGSIDCLTQLLQVNTLYFKGQWQVKFDEQLTVEAPFYPHDGDQRECQTVLLMNRKGVYNTATVDICGVEVQVLEVPYKDNELSLFVLLPTDCSPEALQQLEDSLTYEHLLDWSCDLQPAEVDVFIPKFSLERSVYAIEYLDLENIQDPEKADFSQATPTEGVALTQMVHDTFIEIDEEGDEEPEAPVAPGVNVGKLWNLWLTILSCITSGTIVPRASLPLAGLLDQNERTFQMHAVF